MSDDLERKVKRWRRDRMAFRKEAIILDNGKLLGDCIEQWQEEDFAALDSGEFTHAYLERPRGHSKTSDLGTEAVTELLLGRAGQQLFCAAADEDQARLLYEDVAEKFTRNPLLRSSVAITSKEILARATGSRLRVLPADAPSSFGLRPDLIIIDELAEWRRRELWDSLWTASGKRPNCRVLVISSAGWDKASIAWEVRTHAEQEKDWYFRSRGQCASWIKKSWLEQQERTLPRHVYARLHLNQWVEGVGAFLTFTEVDSIFVGELPAGGMAAIGVDLGVSKDRTVVSLLRRSGDVIIIDKLLAWEGQGSRKVALPEVEGEIAVLAKTFRCPVIVDPWQAILLSQRLRGMGVTVKEYAFGSDSRRRLFSVLLELVRNGKLRSLPHAALRSELIGLEIKDTASGYRVDHQRGRHDDHVVAAALAAQHLVSEYGAGPAAVTWLSDSADQPERGWRRVGGRTEEEFMADLRGQRSGGKRDEYH